MKVWDKSVRWHVSRVPGPLVDRLLSRLIWGGVWYGGHCCFEYIFKVSYFPFLNCFASRTVYSLLLHLDPREKISSPIQDLFCSRKPLTYPGLASVQCGVHGRREYRLFTQRSVSYWTLLLSTVNSELSNEYKFVYVPRWNSSEKNDLVQFSSNTFCSLQALC